MFAFIDTHRDEYGVEPICEQLQISPSGYYEYRTGTRNIWRQPNREQIRATRCTVERLMAGKDYVA